MGSRSCSLQSASRASRAFSEQKEALSSGLSVCTQEHWARAFPSPALPGISPPPPLGLTGLRLFLLWLCQLEAIPHKRSLRVHFLVGQLNMRIGHSRAATAALKECVR